MHVCVQAIYLNKANILCCLLVIMIIYMYSPSIFHFAQKLLMDKTTNVL